MAKLKSELEVTCPCCRASLVIDTNLGRVISHREPERGDKPELDEAARILAAEAARREALFEQSVEAEKGRGDALARRFEEALRQAKQEPITRPDRGLRPGLISRALSARTPAAVPSIARGRGSTSTACSRAPRGRRDSGGAAGLRARSDDAIAAVRPVEQQLLRPSRRCPPPAASRTPPAPADRRPCTP